jgi:hypothetical protein
VSPLRPTTFLAVMIVIGVLAALPFRRASDKDASTAENAISTGPSGQMIESLSTTRNTWTESPAFDPSLAWQPVPMTLPGQRAPELPPMPDSYYDVAFEIERPEPVRDRFPAAADSQRMSFAGSALGTSSQGTSATGTQTGAQRRDGGFSAQAPSLAPTQWGSVTEPVPQGSGPLPERIAVEDLVADRFVYSPIVPPLPPAGRSAISPAGNRIPPHGDSITRSASRGADDESRPKYFIREPD